MIGMFGDKIMIVDFIASYYKPYMTSHVDLPNRILYQKHQEMGKPNQHKLAPCSNAFTVVRKHTRQLLLQHLLCMIPSFLVFYRACSLISHVMIKCHFHSEDFLTTLFCTATCTLQLMYPNCSLPYFSSETHIITYHHFSLIPRGLFCPKFLSLLII